MASANTVPAGTGADSTRSSVGGVRSSASEQRHPAQRRILGVLITTQVIGGVGVAIGVAVGALLAASMGGTGVSGFGQSSLVIGAAVLALPITRLMRRFGRRPGLVVAYGLGAGGAVIVPIAAARHSVALLLIGLFLFGGGNAANYQARYSAVDLAPARHRGRQLSLVVWATTIGAVAGPNLAPVADGVTRRHGLVTYSGPFVFSALAFAAAAVLIAIALRPDPLLTARRLAIGAAGGVGDGPDSDVPGPSGAPESSGLRAAFAEVRASAPARLGMSAVAVGHLVMIAVMAMTPVYIGQSHHGGMSGADTLRIVGLVLSLHIAGMYALSPLTGWLTDRFGRRPVILGGVAVLLVACAVAGTAGESTTWLAVGLTLLGIGWSGTMVAGSTLLTESVGAANRTAVQGLSDFVMGVAGATAGALGGLVMAWSSYQALAALAALATVPLVALAVRPARPANPADQGKGGDERCG